MFVKVLSLTPDIPADEAEAILDLLDNYLLALADASQWFPSPYGGAITVNSVDDAVSAAKDLTRALATDGIEVSISISRGRFDRVHNVSRWNVTSLALNYAARLASLEEAKRHIVVDPVVQQDALRSSRSFETLFGDVQSGKVKRTLLEYYRIEAEDYSQVGDLAFSFVRSGNTTPASLASAVCFDIERYSECTPAEQNTLVDSLNKCVEVILNLNPAGPEDFGPAGDGGYIAFLEGPHGHASANAWAFAQNLVKLSPGFGVPLRVGISKGPVRKSQHRSAVGGTVLYADQISGVPSSGGIAVAKEFWDDLLEPLKTGLSNWEAKKLPGVLEIGHLPSPHYDPDEANPKAFYSGGPASPSDIAADLDVPRTQYVRDWINEKGEPEKAWKINVFNKALHENSKGKNRIIVLYGHSGSGKTTLCRRMIYDLGKAQIPIIDLLSESLDVSPPELVSLESLSPTEITQIFVAIDDIYNENEVRGFAKLLKHLSSAKRPFAVYLTIDTNKWRQIDPKLRNVANYSKCTLTPWHLRGQLDERELRDLVQRLKTHSCLFRLERKTDEAIWAAFSRKAKRGLLPTLIEATRGTEENQNLEAILWDEYFQLSQNAQWAYALVTIFKAFNISVPGPVFENSLTLLTGDAGYFASQEFIAETAEIVLLRPNGSYSARHQLVAETLLNRFRVPELENHNVRILCAVLRSLDISETGVNAPHDSFFKMFNERKVARIIRRLETLTEEIDRGGLGKVQGRNISRLLNSFVRTLQGREYYRHGKELATKSLFVWDHIGNQAFYLRAFCDYKLGEIDLAREAAHELVRAHDYPYHVLHGVVLLCLLHDWSSADDALASFERFHREEASFFTGYLELRRKVDLFTKVGWSDSDFESIPPARRLEKLEDELEEVADEDTVVQRYQTLVRNNHGFFRAFMAFFRYLYRIRPDEDDAPRTRRLRLLEAECRHHIRLHDEHYRTYSKDVRSLLCSNIARSMFKIDYFAKTDQYKDECEKYFQEAIKLKPDNAYAHNWYATFLKESNGDKPGAEHHYRLAIAHQKENALFKYNLALLMFEDDAFDRKRLEEAQGYARQALSLIELGSFWKDFLYWPQNLLNSLTLLLARNDLNDGQRLDEDSSMASDPI